MYPYPSLPPELSPGANNLMVPPGFANLPPGGLPYGRGSGFVSTVSSLAIIFILI